MAIIGSGPAGLAAAFALSAPGVAGRFEVHVYQMGWRAGGKASTGRNSEKGHRVEQNGSHYLFGCYHNCFAMVRQAYEELGPDAGFGRFADNFTPCNVLAGAPWPPPAGDGQPSFIFFPSNLAEPGTGGRYPAPFDYLLMAVQVVLTAVLTVFAGVASSDRARSPTWPARLVSDLFPLCPYQERTRFRRLWGKVMRAGLWLPALLVNGLASGLMPGMSRLLGWLGAWLTNESRVRRLEVRAEATRAWIRRFWARAQTWAAANGLGRGCQPRFQQLATLSELAGTVSLGLLRDRLWRPGSLAAIDHLDFREWLRSHGGEPSACESVFVKCWYDAVIAYECGDPLRPRISAGVALNAIFKAFLTYKGSFAYQMGHEMGDGWVAPLVQVLIARGVQFHFFHRVWDLLPGTDGSGRPVVEGVVVERQVSERPGHQLFLRLPDGRLVWPERPLFDGEPALDLVKAGIDGFYGHDSGHRLTLRRGEDFDDVVCTIPSDALPWQAPSCYAVQPSWQQMVEHVDSAESVSLRIWFAWPLPELGWPHPEPILSGFSWPFSTWEDNCQSLGHESFSPAERPRAVGTVFGSLVGPKKAPPPGEGGLRLLRRQRLQAVRHARRFWHQQAAALWPALGRGESLQTEALFKPAPALVSASSSPGSSPTASARFAAARRPASVAARARLRWQLVRANVGPLERYVLALPGTLQYRLRPHETGYDNLLFAGDWTRNGVEVGCAEGAVISGLQAARHLGGHVPLIVGENDLDGGLLRS